MLQITGKTKHVWLLYSNKEYHSSRDNLAVASYVKGLELGELIPYKRPDQNKFHKQCYIVIYGVGMNPRH